MYYEAIPSAFLSATRALGFPAEHTTSHQPVVTHRSSTSCQSAEPAILQALRTPSTPFPNMIITPLGVVLKKCSSKWRLIMHSLTQKDTGTDITKLPLKYMEVYDAMDSSMRLGPAALMAKLDILLPVRPDDQHLLGMH